MIWLANIRKNKITYTIAATSTHAKAWPAHTLAKRRIKIRLLLDIGEIGLLRSLLHQSAHHGLVGDDRGGNQPTAEQEGDANGLGYLAGAHIGGNAGRAR